MSSKVEYPCQHERHLRLIVTPATPVTLTVQAICEKRGWRKWLAILLRKPVVHTREISGCEMVTVDGVEVGNDL